MKPKDKGSADWNLWADMEEVQLWQAVALSLDIEPNSLPGLDFRPIVGDPFDDCPDEFKRRLKLAVSKFYDANTEIRLSSLREWAEQLKNPWTFPEDFPEQQPTIKEAAKSAPIAVEQKEVTAKAAQTGPRLSMTRAALIAQHKHVWQSIETDIKGASENGLSRAAKAGARDWNEEAAMQWARSKNKLIQPTSAASLNNVMSKLPIRKHRLKG